jgi:hypothetical protein
MNFNDINQWVMHSIVGTRLALNQDGNSGSMTTGAHNENSHRTHHITPRDLHR